MVERRGASCLLVAHPSPPDLGEGWIRKGGNLKKRTQLHPALSQKHDNSGRNH
jgi:hypothetical protein